MKALNGDSPVKSFPNLEAKKQTASNHLKQLKSNVKGLNLTLWKLRCFPRTFISCSDYCKGPFFAAHLFSNYLFLDIYFNENYYLMDWIIMSFSIGNFFRIRWQVFGYVRVLKHSAKFIGKHRCRSLFLIKLQASYFQPETY